LEDFPGGWKLAIPLRVDFIYKLLYTYLMDLLLAILYSAMPLLVIVLMFIKWNKEKP